MIFPVIHHATERHAVTDVTELLAAVQYAHTAEFPRETVLAFEDFTVGLHRAAVVVVDMQIHHVLFIDGGAEITFAHQREFDIVFDDDKRIERGGKDLVKVHALIVNELGREDEIARFRAEMCIRDRSYMA